MEKTLKQKFLNKTVQYLTAVLSSVLTAAFLSMLVYLVLLEIMGGDNVIALLKQYFPSRELRSVSLIPICSVITGVIAIMTFGDKESNGIFVIGDAALKTVSMIFLCFYINFLALKIVAAVCALYLVSAVIRTVLLCKKDPCPQKTDNYNDENETLCDQ